MLFFHIPKTAGTSFCDSVEVSGSFQHVLRDYGDASEKTSLVIKHAVYELKDPFQLSVMSPEATFITGHYSATKYLPHFGCGQLCTFVREPVARVVSEYLHARRHHDLNRSFESFFRSPEMRNRQWKLFGQVPIGIIPVVGVTERYEDSLKLANATFGLSLETQRLNVNTQMRDEYIELVNAHRHGIEHLNPNDVVLYRSARELLDERLAAHEADQPQLMRHCVHRKDVLTGYCWWQGDDTAVELVLERETGEGMPSEVLKRAFATHFSTEAHGYLAPRKGYVGFRIGLDRLPAGQYRLRSQEPDVCILRFTL